MTYFGFFCQASSMLYAIVPGAVAFLFGAAVVILVLVPVELNLVKALIDTIEAWQPGQGIAPLAELALFLSLVLVVHYPVLGNGRGIAFTYIHQAGASQSLAMVLGKSIRLPLLTLEAPAAKDLHERATKLALDQTFLLGLELYSLSIQTLVLLGIIAVQGHWGVALFIAVCIVLQMLVYGRAARAAGQLVRQQTAQQRFLAYLSRLMADKRAGRELRLFKTGAYFRRRWRRGFAAVARQRQRQGASAAAATAVPDLLSAVLFGVVAIALVVLVGQEGRSAGDFVLFFQAVVLLFGQLPNLMNTYRQTRTLEMHWEDYRRYSQLPEDDTSGQPAVADDDFYGVAAEGLAFRYPGGAQPLLKDISFQLKAGTSLAIVGENGSGKSTLIKVLLGVYPPEGGRVRWQTSGGEYSQGGELLSVIYQDFARYFLTVRENIAMGNIARLSEDETLAAALERAGGPGLELGAQLGASFGGVELSEGQWQRLAAARAYARQSKLIIFDEPTAHLDPKAEREAFCQFLNHLTDQAAIVVTHRLGGARLADWIVVLKDGVIVEQGTHQELVDLGGEYKKLYDLQAAWYL